MSDIAKNSHETVLSKREERKRKLQELKSMLMHQKEDKEEKESSEEEEKVEEKKKEKEESSPPKEKHKRKKKSKGEIREKQIKRVTRKHFLAKVPKIDSSSENSSSSSSEESNDSDTQSQSSSSSSSSSSSASTPVKKKQRISTRKLHSEIEKLKEYIKKRNNIKKYKRKKPKNSGLFPSQTSAPRVYPNGNPQSSLYGSKETVPPPSSQSIFKFL